MRLIISLALVACATTLLCHGFFTEPEAREALAAANDIPALRKVMRDHPYGLAAVDAGKQRMRLLENAPPTGSEESFLPRTWQMISNGVREDRAPWVLPPTAGAIGLAGLLLAVLLPGTRHRNIALLLLVAGAVSLFPAYSSPESQAKFAQGLPIIADVVAWNPMISAGLMVLAALTVGGNRRRQD